MAYAQPAAQANILLSATFAYPREELFERARSYQESLEIGYMSENLTISHTIHREFSKELQAVMSTYFEDIRNVTGKGASSQGEPRLLQFPRCSLDPSTPGVAVGAPAPVDPASAAPVDPASVDPPLLDPPIPAGEA